MSDIDEEERNHEKAYIAWVQANAVADIAIFRCNKATAKKEKSIEDRNALITKLDIASAKYRQALAEGEKGHKDD
jgi:uncharacterized protein